ncbi:MAG: alpha/beta fold hydrolase [Actinomycetota bacterium]
MVPSLVHSVDVGDTSVHVVERGEGLPLIVLHGWPGDSHLMFADYLDPLCDGCRLLFVDLRGHGRSGAVSKERWTLERMANDVTLIAERLDLGDFALLGHSFGSFVAIEHAIDHPGSASRTILSCSAASDRFIWAGYDDFEPPELKQQLTEAAREERKVVDADHFARIYRRQLPFFFADPRDPRIDEYWERRNTERFSAEAARFFAVEADIDIEFEERLPTIPQPVLVIAGLHDRATPVEAARGLAQAIPNAELTVLEHSGHWPFVEEPEAYVRAIAAFLGIESH